MRNPRLGVASEGPGLFIGREDLTASIIITLMGPKPRELIKYAANKYQRAAPLARLALRAAPGKYQKMEMDDLLCACMFSFCSDGILCKIAEGHYHAA
jgi:hypothetical protein